MRYFLMANPSLSVFFIILVILGAIRVPGLLGSSIWYDATITLLEVSGHPKPKWPRKPVPAAELKTFFTDQSNPVKIAQDLIHFDVHPPLYYWTLWAWQFVAGKSLEAARTLSLFFSLAAITFLYFWARRAQMACPLIPAVTFGLASGSVYFGHEARNFALATFWIVTCAWLATVAVSIKGNELGRKDTRRQGAFALLSGSVGLTAGMAFLTNYLTVFPITAVFLWLLVLSWRKFRYSFVAGPLVFCVLVVFWLKALLHHTGARQGQASGFMGLWDQGIALVGSAIKNLLLPASLTYPDSLWGLGIFAIIGLFACTVIFIVTERTNAVRPVLILILLLGAAPFLGLFALNIAFDKHLSAHRYTRLPFPRFRCSWHGGRPQIITGYDVLA